MSFNIDTLKKTNLEASKSFEKIVSLVDTTAKLNAILKAIPDIVFLYDSDGKHIEVFSNNESNLVTTKQKFIGSNIDDFHNKSGINKKFKKLISDTIKSGNVKVIEYSMEIGNKLKWFEARSVNVEYELDGKKVILVLVRDITKRRNAENNLSYTATHDILTDLPNRALFYDRLKRSVSRAKRYDKLGALFFLDLNKFKNINDNLGHDIGDDVLVLVARRLKEILREDDTLARLGGDEFVLIAENLTCEEDIHLIINKINTVFKDALVLNQYTLKVSTSIGVTMFPAHSSDINQLVRNADIAMYYAKENNISFKIFEDHLTTESLKHFHMEQALKKAIKNKELYVDYQPQFTISTKTIIGVEALLRWRNPSLGQVPPDVFIKVAEQNGLIMEIGDWVIENVCSQLDGWLKKNDLRNLVVAINLSRVQLSDVMLGERIKKILDKFDFDNSLIEFEITESAVFANPNVARDNIKYLRDLGCLISIDDFGTGFSSLSNLRNFKLDKIKIDKSFVDDIESKNGNEFIIKATIALAKSLNLKVIAEGVENKAQLDFLEEENCDEIQGYIFSKPISAKSLEKMFEK